MESYSVITVILRFPLRLLVPEHVSCIFFNTYTGNGFVTETKTSMSPPVWGSFLTWKMSTFGFIIVHVVRVDFFFLALVVFLQAKRNSTDLRCSFQKKNIQQLQNQRNYLARRTCNTHRWEALRVSRRCDSLLTKSNFRPRVPENSWCLLVLHKPALLKGMLEKEKLNSEEVDVLCYILFKLTFTSTICSTVWGNEGVNTM